MQSIAEHWRQLERRVQDRDQTIRRDRDALADIRLALGNTSSTILSIMPQYQRELIDRVPAGVIQSSDWIILGRAVNAARRRAEAMERWARMPVRAPNKSARWRAAMAAFGDQDDLYEETSRLQRANVQGTQHQRWR